jgi:hypothetical protein
MTTPRKRLTATRQFIRWPLWCGGEGALGLGKERIKGGDVRDSGTVGIPMKGMRTTAAKAKEGRLVARMADARVRGA